MLIKTKPVSAELQSVIAESLQGGSNPKLLREASGRSAKPDVTLSFPHEAYFMRLDDIANGETLAKAYPTSTRVLLSDAERQVYSAAEVSKEMKVTQLDNGPFLQPMLEGISKFYYSPPEGMHDNLEMRLLRIPSLYIVAVWLHGDEGPVDLLMPVGPTAAPLVEYQVYTGADFLSQIRELARDRQKQG